MRKIKFYGIYLILMAFMASFFPTLVNGQVSTTDTITSVVGLDGIFTVNENYHTINGNMVYGKILISLSSDTTNNLMPLINDSIAGSGQKSTTISVALPSGTKIWVVRKWGA